jgi:hypothetical protein
MEPAIVRRTEIWTLRTLISFCYSTQHALVTRLMQVAIDLEQGRKSGGGQSWLGTSLERPGDEDLYWLWSDLHQRYRSHPD